jgi:hypothetical protein
MRRALASLGCTLVLAALVPADEALAVGVRSPVPVAVRARLDVHVLADDAGGEWTVTSRAPSDPSRFMADLTAGDERTGTLYLKGVSSWRDADDARGRVAFELDQGDWSRRLALADSIALEARLFGDERRFFTAEMGAPVVEDDEVARFEHRLGARLDASGQRARASYWIAGLDDGEATRLHQLAAARFAARPAFAGVAYVHDDPESGEDHAVAKGELGGFFRRASAVVSYEQSGFGSGAFLPSGSWGDFEGGGYTAAAPDNSATFAELRTRRTRIGGDHLIDASYRYGSVGAEYTNDLSSLRPGTVRHAAWINWAHRRYALDARLSFHDEVRGAFEHAARRGGSLTSRSRLVDNAEILLRGGLEREELETEEAREGGFVHAGYARDLSGFRGGAHVLVDRIGEGTVTSAGAEARVNWNATSAVFVRWIVSDEVSGSESVFVRLEFRPTRRTWVTIAYGRDDRGDDVYFLEDRDAPPPPGAGDVIAFTVRGDL